MQTNGARNPSLAEAAETPIGAATNRQIDSINRLHDQLSMLKDRLGAVLSSSRADAANAQGGERPTSNIALVQVLDGNADRIDHATSMVADLLDRLGL